MHSHDIAAQTPAGLRWKATTRIALPRSCEQLTALVAEERTVKGSYLGSCEPRRDIPRFIEWFQDGRLPIDRLVSNHLELDQINEAFDTLADGAAVRQVIMM